MGWSRLNPIRADANRRRLVLIVGAGGLLAVIVAVWQFTGRGGEDAPSAEVGRVIRAEESRDEAALAAAVADPNADAARAAIRGLARVAPPASAIPRIRTALADPRAPVRYQAALQLGQYGASARDTLASVREAAARDADASVRAAAAGALGKLQTVEAVEPLVTALNDPDPGVRRAAIGSLQGLLRIEYRNYDPDASESQRRRAVETIRGYLPKHVLAYNLWQKNLQKSAGQGEAVGVKR